MPDESPDIISAAKRYRMFQPGDKVLVAVSGGPDSVAMLHALHTRATEFGITLHVAHLNHRMRGEQSNLDEEFVRDLAHSLKLADHDRACRCARAARRAARRRGRGRPNSPVQVSPGNCCKHRRKQDRNRPHIRRQSGERSTQCHPRMRRRWAWRYPANQRQHREAPDRHKQKRGRSLRHRQCPPLSDR